ncbi:hypothetical protein JCM30204_16980 [Dysgonomonas termitidis]
MGSITLSAQQEGNEYLQKAETSLSQGNCKQAMLWYNTYKNLTNRTDAGIEKRIAACEEVIPALQIENRVETVFFSPKSSAIIDRNQKVNIFNTAKYLQDNPSAKVKVVGYADKKTGTPSINEKLSEKRAKNVANELIKKYNIDSNRVTVVWKGDTVQPYAENAWNEVAILFLY